MKVSFAPKSALIERGGGGEMRASILDINTTQQGIDNICGTDGYNVVVSGEADSGAIYITE